MYGPSHPGEPRWRRLQPADPLDLVLLGIVVLGVAFLVLHHALAGRSTGLGWVDAVAFAVFRAHGSTPVLSFLALGVYLTRWGRTLGRRKLWVWAGVLVTVPLWFLGGLPIAVRTGDVTILVVPWNLLALAVMAMGVVQTLRAPAAARARAP